MSRGGWFILFGLPHHRVGDEGVKKGFSCRLAAHTLSSRVRTRVQWHDSHPPLLMCVPLFHNCSMDFEGTGRTSWQGLLRALKAVDVQTGGAAAGVRTSTGGAGGGSVGGAQPSAFGETVTPVCSSPTALNAVHLPLNNS